MKKKRLSILLALVLVLGMIPNARAATDMGSEPVVLDICDSDFSALSSAATVTYTQGGECLHLHRRLHCHPK